MASASVQITPQWVLDKAQIISDHSSQYSSIDGWARLMKRVRSEVKRCKKLLAIDPKRILSSSNMPVLYEIFQLVQTERRVVCIYHSYKTASGALTEVDITSNGGLRWIKVKTRDPDSIELRCISCQAGNVIAYTKKMVEAAKHNSINGVAPEIVWYFRKGVTEVVRNTLRGLGALSVSQTFESAPIEPTNQRNAVNLGPHSMLTLVSNLSNGGRTDLQVPEIKSMIDRQIATPIIPILNEFIGDRELICCETAVSHFLNIVETIGGPTEQNRCDELMSRITVVEDEITDRVAKLTDEPILQAVFGTGDSLDIPTLTGNQRFVSHAKSNKHYLNAFVHDPKALTEKYELRLKKTECDDPD